MNMPSFKGVGAIYHALAALRPLARVLRSNFFVLLGVLALISPNTAGAQTSHTVEFRRTMHADACDTGDVYVDGKLLAQFSAAPGLIDSRLKTNPFIGDRLTTTAYPAPLGGITNALKGFSAKFESGGQTVEILALDGKQYRDYVRPREKKYALPANMILVGTLIEARECKISSYTDDPYYQYGVADVRIVDRMSNAIFGGMLVFEPYSQGVEAPVLAFVSDASSAAVISAGALRFSRSGLVGSAEAVGNGSPCLFPIEHGTNTRITTNGSYYKRFDDAWFCPQFDLQGGIGGVVIEVRRRPGYIEFQSITKCSSILGLPIQRTYLVDRRPDGSGAAVWTRCLNDEAFARVSETSTIIFADGGSS